MGTISLPSALTLHLIVTFGLVVLIWIIQVLHYPSFSFYEEQNFSQAMHFHQQRITLITLPLMISEIILAVYVLSQSQNIYTNSSLILVGLIWLSTFFIQVPLHERLLKSKEPILIANLVKSNWIRTFLWSFKLMILGWEFYL